MLRCCCWCPWVSAASAWRHCLLMRGETPATLLQVLVRTVSLLQVVVRDGLLLCCWEVQVTLYQARCCYWLLPALALVPAAV